MNGVRLAAEKRRDAPDSWGVAVVAPGNRRLRPAGSTRLRDHVTFIRNRRPNYRHPPARGPFCSRGNVQTSRTVRRSGTDLVFDGDAEIKAINRRQRPLKGGSVFPTRKTELA